LRLPLNLDRLEEEHPGAGRGEVREASDDERQSRPG
jgi:hypothetical protein